MKTRPQTLMALAVATALFAPLPAMADARQAQQIITGNGTDGPYPLAWKHVLFGSETVSLNGQPLHWGADYTFDSDAGTITFTHPLPSTSAAVVRYGYDSATAQAQGGGLSVPLAFGLGRNVSVSGLYGQGNGNQTTPGSLNVGLNGGWQNAHGGALTTKLLFLPALTGKDAQAAPNGLARLGMALGGQTRLGSATQLTFGLSRAGSGLGGAGGSDWQAGQQQISLGSTITPNRVVRADLGYTQSDPTVKGGKSSQAQMRAALALTPSGRMHLATNFVQTTGNTPNQTLSAQATLKPSGKSELDASFSNTNAQVQTNDTHDVGVKAALTANPTLGLTAGFDQSQHGAQNLNTQSIGMCLTPQQAVKIDTSLALSQNASANTQATNVDGTLTPNHLLQITGGYTWRTLTQTQPGTADALDSSQAKLTLAPLAGLHLVGTYDQNPENGSNIQRQADHGLDMQTTLGALSLTGGYLWSRQYASDATATSLQLGLGLRFSSSTQLTGGYKHSLTMGSDTAGCDVYSLGLTRNLGRAFDFSMSGTMQQQMGASATAAHTLTASANLGMKF